MRIQTLAEKLASDMLAHNGIAAIWDLHLAAAAAKRAGKIEMAASLIEIADAAERVLREQERQAPAKRGLARRHPCDADRWLDRRTGGS